MSATTTDTLQPTTPFAPVRRVCVRQFEARRDSRRLITALLGGAGTLFLELFGPEQGRRGKLGNARLAGILQLLASEPGPEEARDHELTLDEAREAVALGAFSRHDLIDVGRGWETIVDCFEMEEALAERQSRADYVVATGELAWRVVVTAISLLVFWLAVA